MSVTFGSDQVLSLIKNYDNEKAKLSIKDENLQNALDPQKDTLLHHAAEYGNPEIVQFLIDAGSQVDARNDYGQTPLMRCFKSDLPCEKVVEILLKAGADILEQDCDGNSAFTTVNSIGWLSEDIRRIEVLKTVLEYENFIFYLSSFDVLLRGNKKIIEPLLQTNIELCTPDVEGRTLVHILAMNSNPGVIEQLHDKHFVVNLRDNFGFTPLMLAAEHGNANAVEFFLNEGADIEDADYYYKTSLFLAFVSDFNADEEKRRTIQVLLERGANVQIEIGHIHEIFGALLKNEERIVFAKLVLAHLALQEALGTVIIDPIRDKINSDRQSKCYFEYCQEQLSMKICSSFTLFDLLTTSERKIESYLRNEEWAPKLIDFQTTIEYFDEIVRKRVSKASEMIDLKKVAAQIVCKFMKIDYDNYPFVADLIVDYLEKPDIECLIIIQNEIF